MKKKSTRNVLIRSIVVAIICEAVVSATSVILSVPAYAQSQEDHAPSSIDVWAAPQSPIQPGFSTPTQSGFSTPTQSVDLVQAADPRLAESGVVINGRTLTMAELAELQATYKTKAKKGKYWYDTKSGLYGKIGWGAAGFMLPGHDFGPLAANASKGMTGIFINGRNVTFGEVQILSQLAGVPIARGRYWLDANGNAGREGNRSPVINLFAASLQQRRNGGGGGSGGGGDNFWSTRFSAGNSSGGSGYVSLPGGGFVSY